MLGFILGSWYVSLTSPNSFIPWDLPSRSGDPFPFAKDPSPVSYCLFIYICVQLLLF